MVVGVYRRFFLRRRGGEGKGARFFETVRLSCTGSGS